MKQLIITAVFIILAVYLANTYILGGTGSLKGQAERIADIMIDDLSTMNTD